MNNIQSPITCADVITFLANAADLRNEAQKKGDRLVTRFDRLQTRLSLKALSAKVIPTDKDGEFRLATNEADRKLAAKIVCQRDKRYCALEARLLEAQRELQWITDQQTNFRFLAQLMSRE